MKLSGNEVNKRIAQACPTVATFDDEGEPINLIASGRGYHFPFSPGSRLDDAMDAVRTLSNENFWRCLEFLKRTIPAYRSTFDQRLLFTASAAEWSVAFLKTIGKWEE